MTTKRTALLLLATLFANLLGYATERPLWLRYPAISPNGNEVAFAYQGDIYKVPVEGGMAKRLTTHSAYDYMPLWAPNGQHIAFVSDRYHGAKDIYIMSAEGGTAKRITTHSNTETPIAFSPDGKYIYYVAHIQDPATSALYPGNVLNELYKVPVEGGRTTQELATPLQRGSISEDGDWLLYEDLKGMENDWRKHHTSSVTKDIILYNFANKSYTPLTTWEGEDRNPVFSPSQKAFYFLSERSGTLNVYKQPLKVGATAKQLTHFTEHPVRFLSVAKNGTICFGYDGEIYTLKEGGTPTLLQIEVINDVSNNATEYLRLSSGITSASVSPDGKQIAYTIRGEVFVTSVEHNSKKRITNTAAEESGVTFGGDNRSLVYASKRNGKSDLYIARIARSEETNFPNATLIEEDVLVKNDDSEKMRPLFSPNGEEIAYIQDRTKIMIYNLKEEKTREITDGRYTTYRGGYINFTWSPDGKWLALEFVDNHHEPYSDIGLVSTIGENNKIYNLTESGYFATNPRFVMGGNAIIYASEQYGMRNHASWGSMNDVMITFLNRESYNKFLLNKEEQELLEEVEKKEREKATVDGEDTTPQKELVVELDNIKRRTLRLTPASSTLGDAYITDNGEKLYYMSAFEGGYDLWVSDLKQRNTKLLKKLDGPYLSLLSQSNGKALFLVGGKSLQKLELPGESLKNITFLAEVELNRATERAFMYEEVRRETAERFYVEDMHGVDWNTLTQHYEKFLPHINNNYDFSEMLSEILGELNVSHTGSGYRVPNYAKRTAELGLFINPQVHPEGLLIDEVIVGGPFDTYTSKAKAGVFIQKIDGVEIKPSTDIFPLLEGKAGKPLLVSFYSPITGERWDEVIKPITRGKLQELLYLRWVEQRAEEVDKLSGGQLGYVHISSMDDESFRRVYQDAMGKYYQREGIVIDIRYNGGGRLHEDIEVFFSGQKYLTQEIRGKYYCDMPSRRWTKPSIMVMCESDYSNAHGTPWVYKTMGIGKLVGMPVPGTMTSVNWVTLQDPSLYFGIPVVGYKTKEGYYLENYQLEPDIKVPLNFNKALRGTDTQLEAAVKELLKR